MAHKTGRYKVVQCPCGCGRTFNSPTNLGAHLKNTGEGNAQWKGNKVKYNALHDYIKYHKPKPAKCTQCGKVTIKLDCANISGKYLRELNDWEWICRSCHMTKDGRMNNLTPFKKGENRR